MPSTPIDNERPTTPDQSESSSAHSTPSRSTNVNGKHPIQRSKEGPSTRRRDHLQNARAALIRWRFNTKRDRYSPSSTTAVTLLPEAALTTLASNARIRTIENIEATLNPPWVMARRHGDEVLAILKRIDDAEMASREKEKELKRQARRRETDARQAEKKRLEELERVRKKEEKARAKAEKDRMTAEAQAAKKAQREADRAEKQRLRELAKPKRAPRKALAGSSVFNAGPSTPVPAQVSLLYQYIHFNLSNRWHSSYQQQHMFLTPIHPAHSQISPYSSISQPQTPVSSYASLAAIPFSQMPTRTPPPMHLPASAPSSHHSEYRDASSSNPLSMEFSTLSTPLLSCTRNPRADSTQP